MKRSLSDVAAAAAPVAKRVKGGGNGGGTSVLLRFPSVVSSATVDLWKAAGGVRFAASPGLRELTLCGAWSADAYSDALLTSLLECVPRLRMLTLIDMSLEGSSFSWLSCVPHLFGLVLHRVRLGGGTAGGTAGGGSTSTSVLSGVQSLCKSLCHVSEHLSVLEVSSSGVDDACVRVLGSCLSCVPRLAVLRLSGNALSRVGVAYAAGLSVKVETAC